MAAGCGDEEADDGGDGGGGPSAPTSLTITLDRDGVEGSQPPERKELDCDGGDEPACAALEGVTAADVAPVPPDTPCTEIYGGPDEVQVTGTLNGEAVDETLTRANGCEIERFDALAPALRELYPGYTPGEALQGGY